MNGRRRRGLSPDERALWAQVAASARPLQPAGAPPPQPPVVPPADTAPKSPEPAALPRHVTVVPPPDPHAALVRAQPHMDRRRFDRLRRGRYEPEARLDLHGMDSARAHAALTGFVLSAHGGGLRLVLVITGKGRAGDTDAVMPQRTGVLRHSVPHWLAAPPLVARILQVTPAHSRHGGAGAFYVYLRRSR